MSLLRIRVQDAWMSQSSPMTQAYPSGGGNVGRKGFDGQTGPCVVIRTNREDKIRITHSYRVKGRRSYSCSFVPVCFTFSTDTGLCRVTFFGMIIQMM